MRNTKTFIQMKIGTRSVLFGAHCFFIHPWFVALAWYRLYGFSVVKDYYVKRTHILDWRLWLAFFVHDIGYLGKPNMDGPEGEEHPYLGARILGRIADGRCMGMYGAWGCFVRYHSRFLAKRDALPYSTLCVADKLAVSLEPWWLYLPRVIATGEIREYMKDGEAGARGEGKYAGEPHTAKTPYQNRRDWFSRMTTYMKQWAFEHRDGKQDKWTPSPITKT